MSPFGREMFLIMLTALTLVAVPVVAIFKWQTLGKNGRIVLFTPLVALALFWCSGWLKQQTKDLGTWLRWATRDNVAFCAKAREKKAKFWRDEPKAETETDYLRRTANYDTEIQNDVTECEEHGYQ